MLNIDDKLCQERGNGILGETWGNYAENASYRQGSLGGKTINSMTKLILNRPKYGNGNAVTKNGNLLRGIVAVLMIAGFVACSENSTPQAPQDLIAKNEHKSLETWSMKEATHLRQRSNDMTVMAERYQKIHRANTEVMARAHRDMVGR